LIMESGAQIAGGVVIYPEGYQRKISKLCKKYDVLLILDEIATGFGRLGNMIEYLAQRSIPDIVCFGKALTAGYFPLAVTLTTDRIFDAFLGNYSDNKQFYHGHTFTGHPLGCAVALANIDLYEKRNIMSQISTNSKYLAKRLREFSKSSIVADIRHKGFLAGIELAWNGKPIQTIKKNYRIEYFVMHESLKMGVFLRPLGNIMLIIPPLAINKNDLGKLLDVQQNLLHAIEKRTRDSSS
jgi:adenosylmethionine-8-amino-7-oxononanoate aminotransferase